MVDGAGKGVVWFEVDLSACNQITALTGFTVGEAVHQRFELTGHGIGMRYRRVITRQLLIDAPGVSCGRDGKNHHQANKNGTEPSIPRCLIHWMWLVRSNALLLAA